MPTYLQESFEMSQGAAGMTSSGCVEAASLAGVLVGGWWADRWSSNDERGRVFVVIIGLLLSGLGIFVSSSVSWLPMAVTGLILFGFTSAFSSPNMMPILCMVAPAQYRATGYGVLNLFACLIGGGTIYAGGMLRDADVDVSRVFQFAALTTVACVVLLRGMLLQTNVGQTVSQLQVTFPRLSRLLLLF